MALCKNCIHFKKESIELGLPNDPFNTWINYAGTIVENPSETAYDFAPCANPLTTIEIVVRAAATDWFFNNENYTNTFLDTLVVGQEDDCPNFEAIP